MESSFEEFLEILEPVINDKQDNNSMEKRFIEQIKSQEQLLEGSYVFMVKGYDENTDFDKTFVYFIFKDRWVEMNISKEYSGKIEINYCYENLKHLKIVRAITGKVANASLSFENSHLYFDISKDVRKGYEDLFRSSIFELESLK